MIFIWGISTRRKFFQNFRQAMTCENCGRYGYYYVFKTYETFTIFFIPTFRWGTKYYVQASCCGKTYLLNPEIGKMIAKGQPVQILPAHMYDMSVRRPCNNSYAGGSKPVTPPSYGANNARSYAATPAPVYAKSQKKCQFCGCVTAAEHAFCPQCGGSI